MSRDGIEAPGPRFDGFVSYSHAADGLLAPRLQAGLQRFAKPWWKRRALRIFRDQSSLSASPHLWGSITQAMNNSAWFVLLVSPDAAASPWVNREIQWWAANKPPDRIIPVLTEGELTWTGHGFGGDAAPTALHGVFSDEPRWVDLRFARGEDQLDLSNPRFSAAVADIASALRGIPKDELESEEVRQHRRTTRTAWGAGVLVLALAIAATTLATIAADRSREATRQADIATRQALIAQAGELTAQSARTLARNREDPELSLLLALDASELTRRAGQPLSRDTISALHAASQASRLVQRLEGGWGSVAIAADGTLFATDNAEGLYPGPEVHVHDGSTGEVVRTLIGQGSAMGLAFSPETSLLAVGYGSVGDESRSEPPLVVVFDVTSGQAVAELEGPTFSIEAGDAGARPLAWSDDGALIAALAWDGHGASVSVWNVGSGRVVASFPVLDWGGIAFIDADTIAVAEGSASRVGLYRVPSGELAGALPTGDFKPGSMKLSPDRSIMVLGSQGSSQIQAWDLATPLSSSSLRWSQPHDTGSIQGISPDSQFVAVTGFDGVIRLFDLATGDEALGLGGLTGASGAAFHPDGRRLIGVGAGGTFTWDISPGGPAVLGTIPAGSRPPFHPYVSPDGKSLAVTTDGPPESPGFGEFVVYDLDTLTPTYELEGQRVNYWAPAALSADWRYVGYVDTRGMGIVRDLLHNADLAGFPCSTPKALSTDGDLVLLDGESLFADGQCLLLPRGVEPSPSVVYDLTTREVVLDLGHRVLFIRGGGFNPGGALEAGRYVTVNDRGGRVEIWDLRSRSLLASIGFTTDEGAADFTFSSGAYDPTGRYLAGGTVNGRAWVVDVAALASGEGLEEALTFNQQVFDGTAGGHRIGNDGLLVVSSVGAQPLRFFDLTSSELLLELDTAAVEGLPLVIFSNDGRWLYYGDTSYRGWVIRRFPLDPEELVAIAESLVTRTLTPDECLRFSSAPSCEETLSEGDDA